MRVQPENLEFNERVNLTGAEAGMLVGSDVDFNKLKALMKIPPAKMEKAPVHERSPGRVGKPLKYDENGEPVIKERVVPKVDAKGNVKTWPSPFECVGKRPIAIIAVVDEPSKKELRPVLKPGIVSWLTIDERRKELEGKPDLGKWPSPPTIPEQIRIVGSLDDARAVAKNIKKSIPDVEFAATKVFVNDEDRLTGKTCSDVIRVYAMPKGMNGPFKFRAIKK